MNYEYNDKPASRWNCVSKHVVPNTTGDWVVKDSGATHASNVFSTQAAAINYGREAARKAHTELFVHAKDGTILAYYHYPDYN